MHVFMATDRIAQRQNSSVLDIPPRLGKLLLDAIIDNIRHAADGKGYAARTDDLFQKQSNRRRHIETKIFKNSVTIRFQTIVILNVVVI